MFPSVITPTYMEDSMSLGAHEPRLYSLALLVTGATGAPVFLHSGIKKWINSYGAVRALGGFLEPNMAGALRSEHMQNWWISPPMWPDRPHPAAPHHTLTYCRHRLLWRIHTQVIWLEFGSQNILG